MDKLKIGMYVRTKYGIGRVDETEIFMDKYFQFHLDNNKGSIHNVTTNTYWNHLEDIIGEPSYEVIDLIEEEDYVNGQLVDQVGYNFQDDFVIKIMEYDGYHSYIYPYEIKSILTKEQYAAMQYLVEENL